MACTTDFIDFICSQLEGVGIIRTRKMFGDWMIYIDEKPIILACDNICYVKLVDGDDSLYVTVKYNNGYASSPNKYISPWEFN